MSWSSLRSFHLVNSLRLYTFWVITEPLRAKPTTHGGRRHTYALCCDAPAQKNGPNVNVGAVADNTILVVTFMDHLHPTIITRARSSREALASNRLSQMKSARNELVEIARTIIFVSETPYQMLQSCKMRVVLCNVRFYAAVDGKSVGSFIQFRLCKIFLVLLEPKRSESFNFCRTKFCRI